MKKYDYILFDLDGTLTDSKPGIVKCIRYALDQKGIPYTDAVLDKMVGPPFRVSMHDFLGLEMPEIEELIGLYRGQYQDGGWEDCKIYDGVEDMLSALQKAGKHLAVATSKPIKFTNLMIDGLNLRHYFYFVGGASSDSSRELKCDVIELSLNGLNVVDKSRALMVGDRLYDIVGAKTVGIDVAGVLYGYGNRDEFEEYGADYILDTPADVVKLVLG